MPVLFDTPLTAAEKRQPAPEAPAVEKPKASEASPEARALVSQYWMVLEQKQSAETTTSATASAAKKFGDSVAYIKR